jgi:hypothetical protein
MTVPIPSPKKVRKTMTTPNQGDPNPQRARRDPEDAGAARFHVEPVHRKSPVAARPPVRQPSNGRK